MNIKQIKRTPALMVRRGPHPKTHKNTTVSAYHAVALMFILTLGTPLALHAQAPNPPPGQGLEQLIYQAIERHPDVAAAHAELRATQAELDVATLQRYPRPTLQLRNDKDGQLAVASVTQPLWTGGRITATVNIAERRATAAGLAVEETGYHLAQRVLAAWTALRQAVGRERVQADNLALLTIYAESVGRRIAAGASAVVDGDLVAARLEQARSDLSGARAARRVARAQLEQLIGNTPGATDIEAQLPGEPPQENNPSDAALTLSFEQLLQDASTYSPTLRRLETEIQAQGFDVDRRRAGLFPSVNLVAEHQRRHVNSLHSRSKDSRIAITLEYAPDAGLSVNSTIAAAQERLTLQKERRESFLRDLGQQLRTDLEDYLEGQSRSLSLQRTLVANRAVLASYDRLLVAGRRSWLEVLNIARDVTAAQSALLDAQVLTESAGYRLQLHTGKLLKNPTKAPT
jgi:adhesin transport system outer membrane protein